MFKGGVGLTIRAIIHGEIPWCPGNMEWKSPEDAGTEPARDLRRYRSTGVGFKKLEVYDTI